MQKAQGTMQENVVLLPIGGVDLEPITGGSIMNDQTNSTIEKTIKWLQVVGSIFVILAGLSAFLIWLTGGLTPGSTVQNNALKDQVADVQRNVGDIKTRLDNLPRPSDFTNLQTQLNDLRTDIGNRMTAQEHLMLILRSDFDHQKADDDARFTSLNNTNRH